MERSETLRVLGEAQRQARLATSSGAATVGPQVPGGLGSGIVLDGVFTKYGRVGITEPRDGFLPRRSGA
jgi:hypothetical protein